MQSSFYAGSCRTTCCDEEIILHPNKVLYWPARKTLLAADIHAGREHAFARQGIPIPAGVSEDTLTLLMQLVDSSGAEHLIILGDLLHTVPTISEPWQAHLQSLLTARTQLDLQVIIGNHDSVDARQNALPELNWQPEIVQPPFVFKHEPQPHSEGYVLAGHVHPVWQLSAGRRNRIKAPVFWFQQEVAVLPSFGLFTGGYVIAPATKDKIFMVGEKAVVPV